MLGKADTPANEGKQEGVQAETEGDKTLGKRKDPQEGGRTIQQRETRRGTMGDKGRQDPWEGGHTIQQRETKRERETRGDKTRGKADTPSNKGKQEGVRGNKGRQGETKPSGRRTHHATKGNKKGDNGRQGETRPPGRRTHHPTKGKQEGRQWGDKGRQDPWEGGHTIQHLKKALRAPNSTPLGDQEGRQGETRGVNLSPREGGHTSQQRETRSGKRGVKGRKEETRLSGSRHHPTKGNKEGNQKGNKKGNKKGDKGRQDSGEGGHTIQRGDR